MSSNRGATPRENAAKWREVALHGHVRVVIRADGLHRQEPTNRRTVSSHDRDCHTATLAAPDPLTPNGAAFLLDHTTRR